jgi:chromate transport protein ChrA
VAKGSSQERKTKLRVKRGLGEPPCLLNLALLFLKIGTIGFGDGMVMIASIGSECVRKNGYIEPDQFLDRIGLSQLLGSFVVNTAVFVGVITGRIVTFDFLFNFIF